MSADSLLSDVLHEAGAASDMVGAACQVLVAAYSEPIRHYHNLAHIEAMLRHVEADRGRFVNPGSVKLAILYHDAVYDPSRSDNEAQSARLASEWLGRLGLPPDVIGCVGHLIDMTRHGAAEPDASDSDLARFLDFDLSILGSEPADYDCYAKAIRREYAHVPWGPYMEGRGRVLRMFIAQPTIYRSPDLRMRWEQPARRNLAHELARLDLGKPE